MLYTDISYATFCKMAKNFEATHKEAGDGGSPATIRNGAEHDIQVSHRTLTIRQIPRLDPFTTSASLEDSEDSVTLIGTRQSYH